MVRMGSTDTLRKSCAQIVRDVVADIETDLQHLVTQRKSENPSQPNLIRKRDGSDWETELLRCLIELGKLHTTLHRKAILALHSN